jgi:hypothetical protein
VDILPAISLSRSQVPPGNEGTRNVDTGIKICGGSTLASDFSEVEKVLPIVVEQASSLEELDTWLKSQDCIQSVRLEDFLIKTNPPQREFVVEFRNNRNSMITKVIDVFVLTNGRFSLSELRDL